MAQEQKTLECPCCKNQDTKEMLLIERGVVNEFQVLTGKENGKIEIGLGSSEYGNAKYTLSCQKCRHEWDVLYDNLEFA